MADVMGLAFPEKFFYFARVSHLGFRVFLISSFQGFRVEIHGEQLPLPF
jgi:hypothetical protein